MERLLYDTAYSGMTFYDVLTLTRDLNALLECYRTYGVRKLQTEKNVGAKVLKY